MTDKPGPVDRFSDYPVDVSIFAHHGEHGPWHNATVSKTFKQGEEYKRTNNFNRSDLLKLNALLPQALTRMQELEQGYQLGDLKERAQARRDGNAHKPGPSHGHDR